MLLKSLVRVLRLRWKHTLTALVLVPLPVLAATMLSGGSMAHLFQRADRDPSLDLALLVEPAVQNTEAVQKDVASKDAPENLLNWKYTPLTSGS